MQEPSGNKLGVGTIPNKGKCETRENFKSWHNLLDMYNKGGWWKCWYKVHRICATKDDNLGLQIIYTFPYSLQSDDLTDDLPH